MLKTEELNGVELIYSGEFFPSNWGGKKFSINDAGIDTLLKNTNTWIEKTGNTPVAVLDHDNSKGTEKLKDIFKSISLGNVKKIYTEIKEKAGKKVKTLMVDFHNMPSQMKELIQKGFAGKRSVDLRLKKDVGLVLDNVAFFGKGEPGVPLLNDLSNAIISMKNCDDISRLSGGQDGIVVQLVTQENQEAKTTDINNIEVIDMDEIVKLQEKIETLTKENESLKAAAISDVKLKDAEAQKEIVVKELNEKISGLEVQLKEKTDEVNAHILLKQKERSVKVASFLDKLQEEKKLPPAERENIEVLFKALGDNDKLIETQMNILSNKPIDPKFKEALPGNDGEKPRSVGDQKSLDEIEKAAKVWCKDNDKDFSDFDDYREALRALEYVKE